MLRCSWCAEVYKYKVKRGQAGGNLRLICLFKNKQIKKQRTFATAGQQMGAEHLIINREASQAALILGLQPAALIDHVARVDWSLLDQIPGERGGSIPVILKFNDFCFVLFFFSHAILRGYKGKIQIKNVV